MDEITARQIASLDLHRDRPLVICDVDEVVLHFVRGFEAFLEERGMWLDPRSYEFEGNVRRRATGEIIGNEELFRLLGEFFSKRIGELEAIEGAAETLERLAAECEIIMLTNLPHEHYDERRANLLRHGMPYPLVTNRGPKGPAVRAMAAARGEPCVLVDDYTDFLESARDHHPETALVHFLHDPRFAVHARPVRNDHVRVSEWQGAERAIREVLDAASSSHGGRNERMPTERKA